MGPANTDPPNVIPVNDPAPGFSGLQPLTIGIAGGSGSGKTTIAEAVLGALPGVVLVQHDSYYRHRPQLSFEERSRVNYDHPDSLETELLIEHLDLKIYVDTDPDVRLARRLGRDIEERGRTTPSVLEQYFAFVLDAL